MKRVIVRNLEGQQTHGAEMLEPLEWIRECVALNHWGKPERWIAEFDLASQGEDASKAIATVEEENQFGEKVTKYKFPADYTIEIHDITLERAEQEAINYGRQCQEFGASLIAYVHALNDSKDLSLEAYSAILQDPSLAAIERCLWNGSIQTARTLIQSTAVGVFTQTEKDIVLAKINDFLTLHGKL